MPVQFHNCFDEFTYFRQMAKHKPVDIEIDKLTRSIENAITGDNFKTEVLKVTSKDIKSLKKSDWLLIGKQKRIKPRKQFISLL